MKGLLPSCALVLSLAPALLLSGGCSSTPALPPMPAWTAPVGAVSPASAPLPAAAQKDDPIRAPLVETEETEGAALSGLYLGFSLATAQPLGDFDGDLALAGPTDLVLVPDLDVGAGGGAYISYRWSMNELLLQYEVTGHDGSFSGAGGEQDSTVHNLDINLRHYFGKQSFMQPYAVGGLGWSRVSIDDGSTLQAGFPPGTTFEDAELTDGINVNLGLGLAIYPLSWLILYGEGMYRFVRYESSDGSDGSSTNSTNVDGDGWRLAAGAAFRLLPSRK